MGDHLNMGSSAQASTFISRDGGVTWAQMFKESTIYEYGDHGSIIVAAPVDQPTKKIYYSWDEGLTWTEFYISDEEIFVENIISEPSSTSL